MRNEADLSYASVLIQLPNAAENVAAAREIFAAYPDLIGVFENPIITLAEKNRVIQKLFPAEIRAFFQVVCQNGRMGEIDDIFAEYDAMIREEKNCAAAILEYVTRPDDRQLASFRRVVQKKTGKSDVHLELKQNPALIGGFILRIGDDTYDRSVRASVKGLHQCLTRGGKKTI